MKIKQQLLFLVLILIFPLILNAKISVDYSKTIKHANDYIKDFQYNKLYIVSGTTNFSVPFEYKNNALAVNSSFKTGGLLNTQEFDISKGESNSSYLFSGRDYFTMTESGSDGVYVIEKRANTNYTLKSKTEKSGVRVTEYVKEKIRVTGTGEYVNPWVFIKPEYKVNITLVNANSNGATSIVETLQVEDKEYPISANKSYFKYKGDMTCSGYYDEVSVNGNKLVIRGLTSDLKCTIKYTPDNFKVTVNATNARVEGNGKSFPAETNGTIKVTGTEGYALSSLSCTNSQSGSYKGGNLIITNIRNDTVCTMYFTNPGKTFSYTGSTASYTVPYTGYYKLESYGAQGNGSGGKGGYASEILLLTKNTSLTINVGGQNGYNGGGSGYYNGGGASTIKKGSTIILAGAGGGGGNSGTAGGKGSGSGGASAGGSGRNGGPGSAGTNGAGGGSGYNYSYQTNCSSCYYGSNTCTGGYVSTNCSSCYYGHNTCSYGCDEECAWCQYDCSGPYGDSFTVRGYCPCLANGGSGSCSNLGCLGRSGYSRTSTSYNGRSNLSAGCNATSARSITVIGICSWDGGCSYGYNCRECGTTRTNCSSCYYGEDTCSYGCDRVWDECKTGSNTCSYGCDTKTVAYKSGYGGTNKFDSSATEKQNLEGQRTGNGQIKINFYKESE